MGKNFERFCEMMEKPAIILNGPTIIGSEKGLESIAKMRIDTATLLSENQELKEKIRLLEKKLALLENGRR